MADLKLNTTNGSVTLKPEDGSGNVDITIPRAGVGKGSKAYYDYNNESTTNISSYASYNVCSITLTPTSLGSKFFITWKVHYGFSNHDIMGTTEIKNGTTVVTPLATVNSGDVDDGYSFGSAGFAAASTVDDWYLSGDASSFLYEPNLTTLSPITLNLSLRNVTNNGLIHLNRTQRGNAADNRAVGAVSSMTVIEIAN